MNPRDPARTDRSGFPHLDGLAQTRIQELVALAMPLRSLRRTGRRPLPFNGETLATVCGVTPSLPFWYEINVHRTVVGSYLTDVRLFNKTADELDLFWVQEHDELEDAVAYLERYDPAGDVTPPRQVAEIASSPVELALRIARLQLRVDQITQHYRALVGDLLNTLSQADHQAGAKPAA
ncbi:hypothetical protein [uncultured Sphingomonas sp.]|uniref:hypothetical protein n=1 Tax=uncultured Sphingomonas sp. TaxID=158754 RepID=UPI0035C997EC